MTAFIFAMGALAVTGWAASIGQAWVAAVLGGGTITAVAAALVYRGKVEASAVDEPERPRNASSKR